jgi:hypothetical protein
MEHENLFQINFILFNIGSIDQHKIDLFETIY